MRSLSFVVPGKPAGKGRPRFGNGRTFTPAATLTAENWVKACAMQAGAEPLHGPVEMTIIAVSAIPKSWSKKRREEALRGCWDTRKPDQDNISKLVCDALNGIAYADDAQVVRALVEKKFATDGIEKTVVIIKELIDAA